MTRIAVGDIGGTHARFALADVADGRVLWLGEPVVLRTSDYERMADAWQAFGRKIAQPLPRIASFGVAGLVQTLRWNIDPGTLEQDLDLDRALLLNDFGAMAYAVDMLPEEHFVHLCGPDVPLPAPGVTTVLGPGTGLGVAALQRTGRGTVVLETEGAHIHFAPLNERERLVNERLTAKYGRTSVERVVSGPGLADIVRTFTPDDPRSDAALWEAAIAGNEPRLSEALALFLDCYGAAAGDLSLTHGALGIALTGGLNNRLLPLFAASGFHAHFRDKGRYRPRMEGIPIKLVTHPQPGLFGAAAAFAREHRP